MLGFKFVSIKSLDYLKAQNRIVNEKLRDTESDIETLKAKLATETRRGNRFEGELHLYDKNFAKLNTLHLKMNEKYEAQIIALKNRHGKELEKPLNRWEEGVAKIKTLEAELASSEGKVKTLRAEVEIYRETIAQTDAPLFQEIMSLVRASFDWNQAVAVLGKLWRRYNLGEAKATPRNFMPLKDYNIPLHEVGLSVTHLNVLARANIELVGQVLELNPVQLLKIRNFGGKSARELYSKLDQMNLLSEKDKARMLKSNREHKSLKYQRDFNEIFHSRS